MEHLPPVGWADVATRRDIDGLQAAIDGLHRDIGRIDGRFDHLETRFDRLHSEFRTTMLAVMS